MDVCWVDLSGFTQAVPAIFCLSIVTVANKPQDNASDNKRLNAESADARQKCNNEMCEE
jgi:hypothetical protein